MSIASKVTAVAVFDPSGTSARPTDRSERIAALLDDAFLAEMGFDFERLVLVVPVNHRLVVRPVCIVSGCSTTAPSGTKICGSCRRRLEAAGLGGDQVHLLDPPRRSSRSPERCRVAGCEREQMPGTSELCRSHLDQHQALGLELDAFLARPDVVALAPNAACGVPACSRQRRHPDGCYCEPHQIRLRVARRREPDLDERRWKAVEPAIGAGGEVSLRGLHPVVVTEVLYGLQSRCLIERVQTRESDLRALCDDLRRQQVPSVGAFIVPPSRRRNLGYVGLAGSIATHARRALATPRARSPEPSGTSASSGTTGRCPSSRSVSAG
ncbi:MAG: hypothetical protein ACRDV8_05350 [Acidimicrobiales bacterium]